MTRKMMIEELARFVAIAKSRPFEEEDKELVGEVIEERIYEARQAGHHDVANRAVAAFNRVGWPVRG